MSVYFTHSGYADHNIEKNVQNDRGSTRQIAKTYIPIVGRDFNAELGLGHGTECISVGRYTLNEGNKRGDWIQHWLMKHWLHSTQHSVVQKNTSETNYLHISKKVTRNKSTTRQPREDTWDTTKTPKPTTWSTCEVTTDVSWQHSRSPRLDREAITRQ